MMDESFNPYLKWLGISLQDQPANHYRLLGIPELIDDADVIDNAASRQMAHVRTFASGKYSQISQQLLNEIAAAKVCLLTPAKKQAYDEKLRQGAARKAVESKPNLSATVNKPALQTRALPQATALRASPPAPVIASSESQSVTRRVRKKSPPAMKAAVLLGLLVLVGIAIWRIGGTPSEDPTVAEQKPIVPSPIVVQSVKSAKVSNADEAPKPEVTNEADSSAKTNEAKIPPATETTPSSASTTKKEESKTFSSGEASESDTTNDTITSAGNDFTQEETGDGSENKEEPTEPEEKTATKVVSPVVKKHPLPAGPELETAQASLREIFKDELAAAKTAEQQRALAKTFLSQVTGDKQSPAEAYVLLNASKMMAIKGADTATTMAAVDKLTERFEIDEADLKAETLTELARTSKTPAEQAALILAIGRTVRALVEVDRFEVAEPLTKLAQSAALQSRNVALRKELAVSIKEFGELQKAYRSAKSALEKLETSPDDAEANLEIGRYRAFMKADWPQGLKNLAIGSDETLRALAAKDIAGTANTSEQVKLGDAWWDVARAEAASSQKGPKLRAGYWYGLALSQLTGLSREHVAKRMTEIRELNPVGRLNPDDWKIWAWDGNRYQDTQAAPLQFEAGALTVANKTNQGDFLLLVYQPLVGDGPFLATIEMKGDVHQIGLVSAERMNSSIFAFGKRDQEWHTITMERKPDKVVTMKIDGNQIEVRNWQSDNNLVGKVAFWLQKGNACTIRWFEVQTNTQK